MGVLRIDRSLDFGRLAGVDGSHEVPKQAKKSAFYDEAQELRQNLVTLEELVRAVHPKYVQPIFFIRMKGSVKMSEREKDEFDADITELVKNCGLKIDALQDATMLPHASTRRVEHEKEVVTYLLERLKAIAALTKRMQKQRTQLPFLMSHRLLPNDERLALADQENALLNTMELAATHATGQQAAQKLIAPVLESKTRNEPTLTRRRAPHARPPAVQHAPVFASQSDEIEFTEEQHTRFHMENVTLHRHFQENFEDAKQMEAKMAEISHLMGQFADKIMDQQTEIEMIHTHAQETTTNIKQSNRILEQTAQIGSGYGVMIFCFYAFFALLLHVLHYFNN